MVDCYLKNGAVGEWSILVCGFCWMTLHRKASVGVDRELKVNNAILENFIDCMEANELEKGSFLKIKEGNGRVCKCLMQS